VWGKYSEIVFDNIHFDPEAKRIRGKNVVESQERRLVELPGHAAA
jgi:hypothetical protein